jgi:hypothetical protein
LGHPDELPSSVASSCESQDSVPTTLSTQDWGFRALVQQEVNAVTIDDLDNDPLFNPAAGLTTYPLIPISNLFDFSNTTWSSILTKHGQHNFDEELDLYELLDLGVAGDNDLELDETTEQILIG